MTGTYTITPAPLHYVKPTVRAPVTLDCNGVIVRDRGFVAHQFPEVFSDEISRARVDYDPQLFSTKYVFDLIPDLPSEKYFQWRRDVKKDPRIVDWLEMLPGATEVLGYIDSMFPIALVSRSHPDAMSNIRAAIRRAGLTIPRQRVFGTNYHHKDAWLRDLGSITHIDNELRPLHNPYLVPNIIWFNGKQRDDMPENVVVFPDWIDPDTGRRLDELVAALTPRTARKRN